MAEGRHSVSLIAPLAALGRADEVVLRVSQAIQLGLLNDGEHLPPEAEFAGQLGVSAMTMREALAVLRQQGLVETRRGRAGGTFVRRPTAPPLGALRHRLRAMTVAELRDLTDEQGAVSGAAARLAATRASTASVRRLLALTDQLASAATTGARIMADSRFHIEVAIASNSERLTALEVALQATLAELLWLPFETPATTGTTATPATAGTLRTSATTGAAGPAGTTATTATAGTLRTSATTGTLRTSATTGTTGADGANDHPAELFNPRAAAGEHAAIAAAIGAEDGSRARLLAEEHAEANLRRLTALRLALPPHP
jgi:GntR family transcriptional regulator, transcriptional repressor for pyruvate dehydrogenase complex